MFTDRNGYTWRIANIADIPFPTRMGGKTPDCPLEAVCKRLYEERGVEPTSDAMLDAFKGHESEVKKCWHHRFTSAQYQRIAELSCRIVTKKIEPDSDEFRQFVKRNSNSVGVQEAVTELFDDPLYWTFQPNDQLGNGQHRLCAMKACGVERVAVETNAAT